MAISDIRQSDKWTEYLKMYGWELFKLRNGSVVRFKPTIFGTLAKCQRPQELLDSDLSEIDEICKEKNVKFIKLEPNLNQDLSLIKRHDFVKSGCPHLATKTLIIDLKKEQKTLWKELSHNARRSVNRAQVSGVKTKSIQNPEKELDEFYQILLNTSKQKKFYVQSFEEIKRKSEAFKTDSYLMNAYDEDGTLCSSQLYLGFNNNVWSIHGATSEKGKTNNAGYKLLWSVLLHFQQKGYDTIDLEGIEDTRYPSFTKNWEGFSSYKMKFGGEVVTFPETYTKFFSKPYRVFAQVGVSL